MLLDVQALVDRMADDHTAMGRRVAVAGQASPLHVRAVALRRCLDHRVGIAIRHGGSAEITLRDAADALTIEVRDHGPGLPSGELERVMEPFYRVEASRNRQSGGAVLGLTIASDITRHHGGQLVLRNAEGGGLAATAVFTHPHPHLQPQRV